jgi:hypothetical protein
VRCPGPYNWNADAIYDAVPSGSSSLFGGLTTDDTVSPHRLLGRYMSLIFDQIFFVVSASFVYVA